MIENLKTALLKQKKLIVIFLLTIFLPCVALSIFGITAIRNERFRMVKEIENEHETKATFIKSKVHRKFEEIHANLQILTQQSPFSKKNYQEIRELIDTRLASNPFIEQVFFEYEGDKPFFPLFQFALKKKDSKARDRLNDNQQDLLTKAEENEFKQKNYRNALLIYRKIFLLNSDRNVKAQMLNAIARNYKKIEQFRSAIRIYQNISTNYPESVTSSGLSLAFIAKLQIIECYQQLNDSQNEIKSALGLYKTILRNPWSLSKDQFQMYANMLTERITEEFNRSDGIDSLDIYKNEFKKSKNIHIERQKQCQIVDNIQNEIIPELEQKLTLPESWEKNILQYSKTIDGHHFLVLASKMSSENGNTPGLVGLTVNSEFLAQNALPAIIAEVQDENSSVVISDFSGNVMYGEKNPDTKILTTTEFFKDHFPPWRIEFYRSETQGLTLHKSFYFWTILTLILILTVGSLLIVRTVSHEMEILKIKSDFVSSVSHELKTPLTSIKALTERLLDDKVKTQDKMKEYYSYIIQDTERLSRLVRNVLDFSKIEEGKKEYEFEETDIAQWLGQMIENFKRENIQRGVRIKRRMEKDIPRIQIDRGALAQALTNLLDNAYKFSSEKKEIEVVLTKNEENVRIDVIDYGIGIPREELNFIFKKFYQGKYGLKQSVKGTGLGLTLVHHIIGAHGGKISVESKVDQGTTFTILLPLKQKSG